MSLMRWLKRTARRSIPVAAPQGELSGDLRAERLRRAVRDFPGRRDVDLARIIYGRDDADLIAADGRRLEAEGQITRDPDTGGFYSARG